MTGPTGISPLEGNTFLIKNEINRVLHPYPYYISCELLLYLFLFFPCGKEKALYEGSSPPSMTREAWQTLVLALDNMGIKTEFHQTEERNVPTCSSAGFPAIDWLCSSPCFQISCEPHVPILPILIGFISISVYTPIREAFIEG